MENLYDVLVVGGGPAGLSAAIYLARAKYRVLVLEKEKFGGQITITSEIVNYPGVERTSGEELTEQMRFQAEDFGAEFLLADVSEMELEGEIKILRTAHGKKFRAPGVVLALGAHPRKIGFTGEKKFQGRGVAYCATCDGEFFTGRDVLVVGGGFAAAEEAMFLTRYASHVTILVRGEAFRCAASVVDKLAQYEKISVRFHTELKEVGGDGIVTRAVLQNNQTGESEVYQAADGGPFGVFVFAGYTPATEQVKNQVLLNEQGYIVTDADQKTSLEGVYAAGDVCIKRLRQVVTAVADGAIAATSLEKHVSECRKRLHLPENTGAGKRRNEARAGATGAAGRDGRTGVAGDAGRETRSGASGMARRRAANPDGENFLSEDMKASLKDVFGKFTETVTVAAVLGTDSAARELEGFAQELKDIHSRVEVTTERNGSVQTSYLELRRDGKTSGIRYYSVPGGHEFNSFVIALYNVAGPGQQLDPSVLRRIQKLQGVHRLQVMTTLSCTNCPEVVMGTQRIASLSDAIEAEMYDAAKFPDLKERYQIMAVPCLVIDEKEICFGKRSLNEILELLEKQVTDAGIKSFVKHSGLR